MFFGTFTLLETHKHRAYQHEIGTGRRNSGNSWATPPPGRISPVRCSGIRQKSDRGWFWAEESCRRLPRVNTDFARCLDATQSVKTRAPTQSVGTRRVVGGHRPIGWSRVPSSVSVRSERCRGTSVPRHPSRVDRSPHDDFLAASRGDAARAGQRGAGRFLWHGCGGDESSGFVFRVCRRTGERPGRRNACRPFGFLRPGNRTGLVLILRRSTSFPECRPANRASSEEVGHEAAAGMA